MESEMVSISGQLQLGWWTVNEDWLNAYLTSTADEIEIYQKFGIIPPLALAARALAGLLDKLDLPPGAVHGGQEFQGHRSAHLGEQVCIVADVARPSQRGHFRFIVAGITVRGRQGDLVLQGKTTVILPRAGASNA